MRIEIELTEEQEEKLMDVHGKICGEQFFVIPAQIKIPNWDNAMQKPKVIGRVLTGEDATEMSRMINGFMRELKDRKNDSVQKDIDV